MCSSDLNPAGLVQLERPEVSIVGSYFVRFEDQDATQANTIVDDQTVFVSLKTSKIEPDKLIALVKSLLHVES